MPCASVPSPQTPKELESARKRANEGGAEEPNPLLQRSGPWKSGVDEAARTHDEIIQATNGEVVGNSGKSARQPAQFAEIPATETITHSTRDEFGVMLQNSCKTSGWCPKSRKPNAHTQIKNKCFSMGPLLERAKSSYKKVRRL